MPVAHLWAFWFLGLGLPIVALHLYRGRRRRAAVPYLRLWEACLQEESHRSALGRLRHIVALLLSLTLLAILTVALARPGDPAAPEADGSGRPLALILDATLSMRAREDGGRRFDLARREADRLARRAGGPVRVFCAGRGVEAVTDVPADREAWTAWLASRAPLGQSGTLVPALEAASAWLAQQGGGRAILLTDGGTRDEPGLADAVKAATADVVACGTAMPNLAITEGRAARAWGERRTDIYFRLRNLSPVPRECTIAATLNDKPSRNFLLKLAPEGSEAVPFSLDVDEECRLTIKVLADDALPEDNAVRLWAPPLRRPRVFVFQTGGGSAFLRKALAVFGDRMEMTGGAFLAPHRWEEASVSLRPEDIVIFDDCGPPGPLRPAAYLFLRGRGPFVPAAGTEVETPGLPAWRPGRLTQGLPEIGMLRVRHAQTFRAEEGVETILDSASGALAVGGERQAEGVRFVAVGFRLEDSNFPLLAAFPVFLRNAFDWLTGEDRRVLRAGYGLGVPLTPRRPLPASAGGEAALRRWAEAGDPGSPQGAWENPLRLPVLDGRFFAPGREDPGFYLLEAGDVREWTAVNFLNEGESDLRPVALPGASAAAAVSGGRSRLWTPEALLVAMALTLLAVDWWLFQRGWI